MIKQKFFPGFPEGAIRIGNTLSILKKDGRVRYFVDSDDYYSHIEGEAHSYRFILATLMENRYVRACDLTKPPLNIPHRTLMNWTSQLRNKGSYSFFQAAKAHTARVITPEIALECSVLLADGNSVSAVAKRLGINDSTLRKAIQRGLITKMPEGISKTIATGDVTTKSASSREDAEAAS